eukprot:g4175.t1
MEPTANSTAAYDKDGDNAISRDEWIEGPVEKSLSSVADEYHQQRAEEKSVSEQIVEVDKDEMDERRRRLRLYKRRHNRLLDTVREKDYQGKVLQEERQRREKLYTEEQKRLRDKERRVRAETVERKQKRREEKTNKGIARRKGLYETQKKKIHDRESTRSRKKNTKKKRAPTNEGERYEDNAKHYHSNIELRKSSKFMKRGTKDAPGYMEPTANSTAAYAISRHNKHHVQEKLYLQENKQSQGNKRYAWNDHRGGYVSHQERVAEFLNTYGSKDAAIFQEFRQELSNMVYLHDVLKVKNLRCAFAWADIENKGSLNASQFIAAMKKVGLSFNRSQCFSLLAAMFRVNKATRPEHDLGDREAILQRINMDQFLWLFIQFQPASHEVDIPVPPMEAASRNDLDPEDFPFQKHMNGVFGRIAKWNGTENYQLRHMMRFHERECMEGLRDANLVEMTQGYMRPVYNHDQAVFHPLLRKEKERKKAEHEVEVLHKYLAPKVLTRAQKAMRDARKEREEQKKKDRHHLLHAAIEDGKEIKVSARLWETKKLTPEDEYFVKVEEKREILRDWPRIKKRLKKVSLISGAIITIEYMRKTFGHDYLRSLAMFESFDTAKSGLISVEEFKVAFHLLNTGINHTDTDNLVNYLPYGDRSMMIPYVPVLQLLHESDPYFKIAYNIKPSNQEKAVPVNTQDRLKGRSTWKHPLYGLRRSGGYGHRGGFDTRHHYDTLTAQKFGGKSGRVIEAIPRVTKFKHLKHKELSPKTNPNSHPPEPVAKTHPQAQAVGPPKRRRVSSYWLK